LACILYGGNYFLHFSKEEPRKMDWRESNEVNLLLVVEERSEQILFNKPL
jgi:hypothetical protein